MENHDRKIPSGNGFLFGVILGAVVTLLFTTKKGREIVKNLTEKGADRLSELQDNIDKAVEKGEAEESDYLEPEDRPKQQIEPEKPKLLAKEPSSSSKIKTEKARQEKVNSPTKSPERAVKRFFRMKKS